MRLRIADTEAIKLLLAILLGLTAAYIVCLLAGTVLAGMAMDSQRELAALVSARQPSIFYAGASQKTAKIPIGFSAFAVPDARPAPRDETPNLSSEASAIKDFKLVGTLPSVGAWIDVKGDSTFVLKGGEHLGYILEEIKPEYAVFEGDGKKFPIYMVYWSPNNNRRPSPVRPPRVPAVMEPVPEPAAAGETGVILAQPNGDDGTITREILNELMANPLKELGNNRLIPTENGMRIAGMTSGSLLLKLGMKPDDVITNVNGISISNVGNAANVISSMLAGSRLDFQVERGGESINLGYAVK